MAPAEANLVQIQLHRMAPTINLEFGSIPTAGLYALAVSSLDRQGNAQSQLLRQERRLLTQYQKLRDMLQSLPDVPPPATPELVGFQSGWPGCLRPWPPRPDGGWSLYRSSIESRGSPVAIRSALVALNGI